MAKKYELPSAPIARLIKNVGAKRVSADGVDALREILEDFATEVARHAYEIAKHSGRKTVMGKDIKMALK